MPPDAPPVGNGESMDYLLDSVLTLLLSVVTRAVCFQHALAVPLLVYGDKSWEALPLPTRNR